MGKVKRTIKKSQDEKNLTLHPLWAQEYWQLKALFQDDPTIVVGEVDNQLKKCEITCEDHHKAEILADELVTFALDVEIKLKDFNEEDTETKIAYLFKDNPIFSKLYEGDKYKALLFRQAAINYFSDDAFSPSGRSALTAEQLAKIFFKGVVIKTNVTAWEF